MWYICIHVTKSIKRENTIKSTDNTAYYWALQGWQFKEDNTCLTENIFYIHKHEKVLVKPSVVKCCSYKQNTCLISVVLRFIDGQPLTLSMTRLSSWLEKSRCTSALVQADIASPGTADSFLEASHLTRTRHANQVTASSLFILSNRAYVTYRDFASQWNTDGIRCIAWARH